MKEDLVDDAFDAHEYCGSEFNFSSFVEGEIHVSDWNGLFKSCKGEPVFFRKLVV